MCSLFLYYAARMGTNRENCIFLDHERTGLAITTTNRHTRLMPPAASTESDDHTQHNPPIKNKRESFCNTRCLHAGQQEG